MLIRFVARKKNWVVARYSVLSSSAGARYRIAGGPPMLNRPLAIPDKLPVMTLRIGVGRKWILGAMNEKKIERPIKINPSSVFKVDDSIPPARNDDTPVRIRAGIRSGTQILHWICL